MPDGTYTIFGTITNDGNAPVTVRVGGGTKAVPEDIKLISVPAASDSKPGTASFTLTFWAASNSDVAAGYWVIDGVDNESWIMIDLTSVDFVNMPDNTVHTVDQGPMSDLFVVFANGAFDFGSSVLYSFVK